jgi:AcrR family transcriptional regulator
MSDTVLSGAAGKTPRRYSSANRREAAEQTRRRMLDAARERFSADGVDGVTIERIADEAGVSPSTVYAAFKSKSGILREIMREAIFSAQYRSAAAKLEEAMDPIAMLRLTATVARTIYENEAREIGVLRGISLFSSELRALEQEFETARYELQRARVELLAQQSLLANGLSVDRARRVMWMYTSRDVYRMMVIEGGWTPDEFEAWLGDTLITALTKRSAG